MQFRELISRLLPFYDEGEARAIIRLLLEVRFSLSWTDVLCGALAQLDDSRLSDLEQLMQRLEQGEPVQYVLEEAEFLGRSFHVEPGVLIPRIETEEIFPLLPGDSSPLRLLDIGTGSGCIAITAALEHPSWMVDAWDISPDALRIASGNAQRFGANVNFREVDILKAEPVEADYSVIISNPPYICNSEKSEIEAHVLDHEPSLALFVPDDDPLLFYRHITLFAAKALQPDGMLVFEINRRFGHEVAELMKEHGFNNVKIVKDQFDNDRIVTARR